MGIELWRENSDISSDEPPSDHPYWSYSEHPGVFGECPVCQANEENAVRVEPEVWLGPERCLQCDSPDLGIDDGAVFCYSCKTSDNDE